MKTIWKYQLVIQDSQPLTMPKGAEILTVQVQNNIPCIWALVDPDAEIEHREFCMFGTGHDFGLIDYKYIGTFQIHEGLLAFHLFESNI
jgi:hypothetical protein